MAELRYIRRVRPLGALLFGFVWLAVFACDPVPELTFVSPDATTDGSPPTDGGGDGQPVTDAEGDGEGGADGGFVNTCPNPKPPGVDSCCGLTPCVGRRCGDVTRCNGCNTDCVGRVCCWERGGSGNTFNGCADRPEDCP